MVAELKQEANGLVLMDMGQHVVQDYPQPLSLHQVLLPGLEDRARAFPPLSSAKQLAPGRVHYHLDSFPHPSTAALNPLSRCPCIMCGKTKPGPVHPSALQSSLPLAGCITSTTDWGLALRLKLLLGFAGNLFEHSWQACSDVTASDLEALAMAAALSLPTLFEYS